MISFGHIFVKSGKNDDYYDTRKMCGKNKHWCETIKHVKMYKNREWERNVML